MLVAMFFYCCAPKGNQNNTINFTEVAQGVGKEVVVKYTDSGRLVAIMKAPVFKDFTHIDFPYREFPKGVELIVFDKKGGQSNVKADFGVQYELTNLVDLRGNVKIVTADSVLVNAPQLYWDQKLHWLYTDNDYDAVLKNGAKNKGAGFDVNEDFTNFRSRTNVGTQILND
ncbi:hypothetical protein [Aquimarina agarivorans]|uniref:hypothetical protein n=1 Tax=Aquimarina agarivorans TaxID=980584 RepID=UPI000248FB1E|nr:hypothetical protein [Aquimarina agarivorans]